MKDKVFLDTNVLVYAKLKDEENKQKRESAVSLIGRIQGLPVISVIDNSPFSGGMMSYISLPTVYHQIISGL